MKVTPQVAADLEEYPELRKLLSVTLRPVVDIMGAHAIASIRRIRKTGVFDHPYDKDVVAAMDIPGVPVSVQASQYAVAKALLDYLAAIGVSGIMVEAAPEELQGIAKLWMPRGCPVDGGQSPKAPDQQAPAGEKPAPEPTADPTKQTDKESQDGGHTTED